MNLKYKKSIFITLEVIDNVYLLRNSYRKERVYIINEVIYKFLNYFDNLSDFRGVVKYFCTFMPKETSEKEVGEILLPFFNQAIINNILILESATEKIPDSFNKFNVNDFILDYRVIKIISDTKYFDIYLVEKNNNFFVIKYLNMDKFIDKKSYVSYAKILEKEYEILYSLDSDNICKVFYFNKDLNNCFIVMKFYDGFNINEYYLFNEITIEQKIKLVYQLLSTFSYLHEKKLYHGDIHFGNIFVESKNNRLIVLDFGLSGYFHDESIVYDKNLKVGGVHFFMPPERITLKNGLKNGKYKHIKDFSSEVYQLGLMIYFIIFNKLPFNSTTTNTLFSEKKLYRPEKDNTLNSFFLLNLSSLIKKSLFRENKKRYKDASEMFKEFKKNV
jgi:serine/threonine protein kinase